MIILVPAITKAAFCIQSALITTGSFLYSYNVAQLLHYIAYIHLEVCVDLITSKNCFLISKTF